MKKNTNFRTWKSGKSWLFASSILVALAGGTIAGATDANAQSILTNPNGLAEVGTENTATGGMGSDAVAGSDNASLADQTGSLATDAGATAGSNTNTNGSYAVNASGLPSSAVSLANGSSIPNSTTGMLLNSAGAVQAGSGASSSVSFDVAQTVSVNPSFAILGNGSYAWTISAPSDLASAGLSVDGVQVAYSGTVMANGLGTVLINSNTAVAQTAGGTYMTLNQNAGSYYPSSAASDFILTSSAYAVDVSYAAAVSSLSAEDTQLSSLYVQAQSMYNSAFSSGGYTTLAASLAGDMISIQTAITANQTSMYFLDNSTSFAGYVVTSLSSSEALVSVEYTTDPGDIGIGLLQSALAAIVGPSTATVTAAAAAMGQAITTANQALGSILNGNFTAYVLNNFMGLNVPSSIINLLPSVSLNDIINGGTAAVSGLIAALNTLLPQLNLQGVEAGLGSFSSAIQGVVTEVASAFQQYAQSAQAAVDSVNGATQTLLNAISSTNGMFTLNFLAPVTQNADGTYTVDAGSASFQEALKNWVSQIFNNYTTTVQNALISLESLPLPILNLGIPSTGVGFLDGISNFVVSGLSTAFSAYNGIIATVNTGIGGALTSLSNAVSQFLGGIGSSIVNFNATGTANVTLGFTAQNPTTVYVNEKVPNNEFVPETFTVTPTVVNGSSSSLTSGNTSVVYQYKSENPTLTIKAGAEDTTVWSLKDGGAAFDPSTVLTVTNADGTAGNMANVVVSGLNQNAVGDYTVTYTYTDPTTGGTATATSTVYVAGITAQIKVGSNDTLTAAPNQVAYGVVSIENAMGYAGGAYIMTGTLVDNATGKVVATGTANFTIDSLGDATPQVTYTFDGTGLGAHTVHGVYTFAPAAAATASTSVQTQASSIQNVQTAATTVTATNGDIPSVTDPGVGIEGYPTITVNAEDTTIWQGTTFDPSTVVSVTNSDGSAGNLANLTVSGLNTATIGNYTVTYSYVDPITKLTATATSTVHVAGDSAQIKAGNSGVLTAASNQVAYGVVSIENAVSYEGGNYVMTGTLYDKNTGKVITTSTVNFTIDNQGNATPIVTYNFNGTGLGGHTVYGVYTFASASQTQAATPTAVTTQGSVVQTQASSTTSSATTAATIPTITDSGLNVTAAGSTTPTSSIPTTSDSGLGVGNSESTAPSEIPSTSDSGLGVGNSESSAPSEIPSTSDSGLRVTPSNSSAPSEAPSEAPAQSETPKPEAPAPVALPETGDSDSEALLMELSGVTLLVGATTIVSIKRRKNGKKA